MFLITQFQDSFDYMFMCNGISFLYWRTITNVKEEKTYRKLNYKTIKINLFFSFTVMITFKKMPKSSWPHQSSILVDIFQNRNLLKAETIGIFKKYINNLSQVFYLLTPINWCKNKICFWVLWNVYIEIFRAILNKTKEDVIRNTNIRLELGVDEIKKYIQKGKLRWFRHVMQMGEENATLKNGGKDQESIG